MKRTVKTAWMAVLAAGLLVPQAWASMMGIGREGDYVLEIFAERAEVVRSAGGTTVKLPGEAEKLFRAAGVQAGDGVWTGDGGGTEQAGASMVRLVSGWWSCELKLQETVRSAPQPVERFRLVRWADLGGRFAAQLEGLAQTNEAAWRDGLEDVLSRAGTLFGGQSMVVGFPGTKYAAEYGKLKRAFDRCVRKGQMRGFGAGRSLQSAYHAFFGEEWPTARPAVFMAGDERPMEIRHIVGADRKPLPDVFETPLPVRLEGTNRMEGVFPAGAALHIGFAAADGGEGTDVKERVFSWTPEDGEECPVWFLFQAVPAGEDAAYSKTLLENAGSVAVAVTVNMGGVSRTCTLPANERAVLCLVTRPGIRLGVDGEPDADDPFARDWTVTARKESASVVRFDSVRKAQPGLVLNNPEMMPVDVTVAPEGGGWGSATKLTLQSGETGIGIPVPAHKPLVVSYRFRSDFHKAGSTDIPPLFYGDRSNLVLRAELKGDPEVVVQNTGPVTVRLVGMATPAGHVDIPAGKSAKVTVPAGKKAVLTGRAAKADYQCEPVLLGAMDPGETAHAKVRMSLKPAPQIILRNTGGMMDVEATLMSAAGRPMGKPFTVKRGASSRPMPLPETSSAYFRISYRNGRFTAQGRLDVPAVPRGETRTLDIPNPTDGVRLQTPGTSAVSTPATGTPSPASVPVRAKP